MGLTRPTKVQQKGRCSLTHIVILVATLKRKGDFVKDTYFSKVPYYHVCVIADTDQIFVQLQQL